MSRSGGYVLVYKEQGKSTGNEVAAVTAITQRLKLADIAAEVDSPQTGTFRIGLIGADAATVSQAKQLLSYQGDLEFQIVALRGGDDEVISRFDGAKPAPPEDSKPGARWATFDPDVTQFLDPGVVTRTSSGDKSEVLLLADGEGVTGNHITSAAVSQDESLSPCIMLSLNDEGAERMRLLSLSDVPDGAQAVPRMLAIVLDGKVITAPFIRGKMGGHVQITGKFKTEEAQAIVSVLQAGRFPIALQPQPVSEVKVEPGQPLPALP